MLLLGPWITVFKWDTGTMYIRLPTAMQLIEIRCTTLNEILY